MCGLIYGRSKNQVRPINKTIIKQYLKQKNRGTEGFGVYDIDFEKLVKETKETNIIRWLKKHPSMELLFHHRFPTSTDNVRNAAHPFSTKDYFKDKEYILIHNGVIRNTERLADEHGTREIIYQSAQPDGRFNDSEALLWDIALYLEGEIESPHSEGSVAFICIEKDKKNPEKNKLHYFHNSGNPLFKRDTNKFFVLASEANSNQDESVPTGTLFSYKYEDKITDERILILPQNNWNHTVPTRNTSTYPREEPTLEYEEEYQSLREQIDYQENRNSLGWDYDDQMTKQLELIKDHNKIAEDFRKMCIEYLTYADGYYEVALGMMEEEMGDLDKKNYSLRNWYRKELLRGACAILLADPKRIEKGTESIHPAFIKAKIEDKEDTSLQTKEEDDGVYVSIPFNEAKQVALIEDDRKGLIREAIKSGSDSFMRGLHNHFTVSNEVATKSLPGKEMGLFREIPRVDTEQLTLPTGN